HTYCGCGNRPAATVLAYILRTRRKSKRSYVRSQGVCRLTRECIVMGSRGEGIRFTRERVHRPVVEIHCYYISIQQLSTTGELDPVGCP
ncbi:hypothetical protein GBAR_LOCUS4960, partial [Geodia barretti]